MGTTCCQPNHNVQIQNMSKIAYLSDYSQSNWPEDPHLLSQLNLSNIYNKSQELTPLKHKVYNRWYWGHWINGSPVGKGILYNRLAKDTIYYQGEFDGEPDGLGRVVYNGGHWEYYGQISKGKAEGKGTIINRKQGYQYNGQWKQSKPTTGTLVLFNIFGDQQKKLPKNCNYISGNITIQLNNTKQHGESVIKYPDGKIYRGEINKTRFYPEGKGQITFPNKDKYTGDWYDGDMHGKGKFTWHDGSYYDGDYHYGKKHGMGKFVFASGNTYQGYWKDGRQNGKGILYDKNKKQIKNGQWKEGLFQQTNLNIK